MPHKTNKKQGRNLLLVVATGSVAALNVPGLVDGLRARSSYSVVVVLSAGAERFVTPDAITQGGGALHCFTNQDQIYQNESTHIWLADRVLATIVFPASAAFVASLAHGDGHGLAATTMLAVADQPVMVTPVMHNQMWSNPFFQENLQRLSEAGYHLVHTADGNSPSVPTVTEAFLELLEPQPVILPHMRSS